VATPERKLAACQAVHWSDLIAAPPDEKSAAAASSRSRAPSAPGARGEDVSGVVMVRSGPFRPQSVVRFAHPQRRAMGETAV
jgi:hypothetical protein